MPQLIASETQKYGSAIYTVMLDPGAVTAGTSIPLPDWARNADNMLHCVVIRITTDTDGVTPGTGHVATKTIVAKGTATPATGQACLYDANNIRLGDDTTALDLILATLIYKSYTIQL